MVMVQDCEAQQMAELTDFLEAEMEFVQSYYEILSELKSDWERRCVSMVFGLDPFCDAMLKMTFFYAADRAQHLDHDPSRRLLYPKRKHLLPAGRPRLLD
jgi:hypothetical protein